MSASVQTADPTELRISSATQHQKMFAYRQRSVFTTPPTDRSWDGRACTLLIRSTSDQVHCESVYCNFGTASGSSGRCCISDSYVCPAKLGLYASTLCIDSSFLGRVAKHEHVPEALAVEVVQLARLLLDHGAGGDVISAVSLFPHYLPTCGLELYTERHIFLGLASSRVQFPEHHDGAGCGAPASCTRPLIRSLKA